ncbi:hypothetical protein MBRA_03788 [Methylobacterium brachiatum]|nr:hypothetical protein MBRA_03788 [Methylobacterium brachiatum]
MSGQSGDGWGARKLSTQFLAGEQILAALRKANEAHAVRLLGAPYWGADAVERLHLGKNLSATRVICDLWSEGGHPDAISELVAKGAQVVTVEGFNAKTYLYPDSVVLGSANAARDAISSSDEAPARVETALQCCDKSVLREISIWYEMIWKRGSPVDAAMIGAARHHLAKVRKTQRPTLLQALSQGMTLLNNIDIRVALYDLDEASDEANFAWSGFKSEYSESDIRGYDARGESPFYEIEDEQVGKSPEGRIFLDFPRPKRKKPKFEGVWQVRINGRKRIVNTDRFIILLDRLPSLRGCRIVDKEMRTFGDALANLPSDDYRINSPEIQKAIQNAIRHVEA